MPMVRRYRTFIQSVRSSVGRKPLGVPPDTSEHGKRRFRPSLWFSYIKMITITLTRHDSYASFDLKLLS
jgi:hypothetical protein